MTFRKLSGLLAVVCVFSAFTDVCSAQHFSRLRQPIQTPMRWLGEGIGPGYNYCNPGPNVDYYNPYSAANSTLISRLPEYQHLLRSNTYQQSRTFHRGVPFSVYAAPQGHQPYPAYGYGSNMIESSYEPVEDGQDEKVDSEAETDEDPFVGEDNNNAFRIRRQTINGPIPAAPVGVQYGTPIPIGGPIVASPPVPTIEPLKPMNGQSDGLFNPFENQ